MKIILSLLLLAMLSTCALCADPVKKFDFPVERFSIEVPTGWKEIPKQVLDDYVKTISTMMPKAETQPYVTGFQLASQQEWLTHPYIIIQINNKSGRVPERELSKLKQLKEIMEKKLDDVQKNMAAVYSQAKIGEPIYDEDARILWVNISMTVQGVGVVKDLSGMHLTEEGLLCVHCYALEKNFETYAPIFETVVKSVVLDPTLKYVPRSSDSMPGVVGGVVGGMAAVYFLRKRNAARA